MESLKFFVGCSGYYYSFWKGRFYPKEVAPNNWLTYYSSILNTVELNNTFYKMPQIGALKRYHDLTPPNFRFSVKMSRYITHIKRLDGIKNEIMSFQDLVRNGLQDKLAHFLFQLPPSFRYSEENLTRVINSVPHDPINVVEFRHASWWNDEVIAILREAGISFCNVDFPGMTTPLKWTTYKFYMRFHGNPVLFKSIYSNEQLEKFFSDLPSGPTEFSIYYNNTYYEAGYTNAVQLMNIIVRSKNEGHE